MAGVIPDASVRLFSYGTLRDPQVQLATFGRLLDGEPDAVVGYRLETLTITDPTVIARSRSDRHPVLRASEEPAAAVEGTVFVISEQELLAADAYEVDDYARTSVPLRSGARAWVYVLSEDRGDVYGAA
jgi:gamma-glutamylcyclotransferase (GGCT)/AIG2-like uncharacterized protein YtfP